MFIRASQISIAITLDVALFEDIYTRKAETAGPSKGLGSSYMGLRAACIQMLISQGPEVGQAVKVTSHPLRGVVCRWR
jgi:hypothetical protein